MADDDNQLLSNDDLDALFANPGGGGDKEEAAGAAPSAAAALSAGEPTLLGASDSGGDDDGGLDAMQLDQAAIDALFSGGMPTAPPSKPKLTPRLSTPEAKPAPARAEAAAPARAGARTGKAAQVGDLDLLAEVVLVLSAEIGRTDMSISDVLKLRPGSIVELDKLAGEPVELYVNDCCIARGEVVVVDDSFGVRITELGEGQ